MLPEANTRQFPSTWTKMAECQDHLLVQLPSNSQEYRGMESLFLTHMADKLVTICSIDRIQNHFLWDKYTRYNIVVFKFAILYTRCLLIASLRYHMFSGKAHAQNLRAFLLVNIEIDRHD